MVKSSTKIRVIIPAAGSGERLGGDLPKQYLPLGGKPVLTHVLEKFKDYPITVAISPDHEDLYRQASNDFDNTQFIAGGNTRKQSIYNALQSFSNLNSNDLILIHDAARPFVRADEIEAVIAKAAETGAATLASPLSATLFDSKTGETVDRSDKWAIQTPQVFRADWLLEAHKRFKDDDSFTDDSGLIRALGHEVALVRSGRHNFKITTMQDYDMAQTLINAQSRTITTMGYDIHAFAEGGDHVTLGGIKIPHSKGMNAHSDGDVILHALTDSILGAIGAGDIGTHFPPSDDQWKNADSAIFVKHALDLLQKHGGDLIHIDINLQCQAPKIAPHRDAMIENLSKLTGLSPSSIGLKATTLEGLGALGREEGIAAYVMTTIKS